MEALNYWKKAFQQPNNNNNSTNLPLNRNTISNLRYLRYATNPTKSNPIQQSMGFATTNGMF